MLISIYPFKAITPKIDQLAFINKLFNSVELLNNNFISCKNKIQHIESHLGVNLLKDKLSSFYCCRIKNTSENLDVSGIVALIDISLLNQKIFMHERCIKEKQDQYEILFSKYKLQTAPVILMHEHNIEIINSLNITQKSKPFIKTESNGYKFELWKVNNYLHYQKLYANVDKMVVADGHHRIMAMYRLNNQKIMAFIVSRNQIRSSSILRLYNEISDLDINNLSEFFSKIKNFRKSDLSEDICSSRRFLCKLENYTYVTSSNNKNIKKVLSYVDENINYKKGKLNFTNYAYNKNNGLFLYKSKIALVIPSFQSVNDIKNTDLYPPHSTLFYPKIPDGLIVYINKVILET